MSCNICGCGCQGPSIPPSAESVSDAALAACAELRAALEMHPGREQCCRPDMSDGMVRHDDGCRVLHALSSDAGRGWVSPEEHAKVIAELDRRYGEKEAYRDRAITAETKLKAAHSPRGHYTDKEHYCDRAYVSPAAFDAALREVADAVALAVLAGSSKNSSRCADGGRCDHYECREDRMFAVTNRRRAIDDIIAAAKAKYGGGR